MKILVLALTLAIGVLGGSGRHPEYGFQSARGRPTEFIPYQANQYKARLMREAHAAGGLSAPVPVFAAQIQQESGWRPSVHSGVGAMGLAEFMPGSAQWIANLYPADLKPAAPYDAAWSIRALVRYDLWLYARLSGYAAGDERYAAALAAYNGGLGWIQKDARLGHCSTWFGCGDSVADGRSAANLAQNRNYPARILQLLRPLYVVAGWK